MSACIFWDEPVEWTGKSWRNVKTTSQISDDRGEGETVHEYHRFSAREYHRLWRANHPTYYRDYYRENVIDVGGGVKVNRRTADPELIAVAELIKETRKVIREVKQK